MTVYELTVPRLRRHLQNLDGWLVKAVDFAATKKFDANTLLTARLAPDQFAFGRQIQATCDHAKFMVARLSGTEAPAHPDTETTIEELRARIATVLAYVDGFTPAHFEGAEERRILLAFMPGNWIAGRDYLVELAWPNFFFHLTTAYAILRHNGVDLGKRDYIGGVTLHPIEQAS